MTQEPSGAAAALAAIRQAEREVVARVEQAHADARERLAQARSRANRIEEEAKQTGKRDAAAAFETSRMEAAAEMERLLATSDDQAHEIRRRAVERQTVAVAAIVSYILPVTDADLPRTQR
jgi:vacuolar-type H+-ATPase subunit H